MARRRRGQSPISTILGYFMSASIDAAEQALEIAEAVVINRRMTAAQAKLEPILAARTAAPTAYPDGPLVAGTWGDGSVAGTQPVRRSKTTARKPKVARGRRSVIEDGERIAAASTMPIKRRGRGRPRREDVTTPVQAIPPVAILHDGGLSDLPTQVVADEDQE